MLVFWVKYSKGLSNQFYYLLYENNCNILWQSMPQTEQTQLYIYSNPGYICPYLERQQRMAKTEPKNLYRYSTPGCNCLYTEHQQSMGQISKQNYTDIFSRLYS